MSGFFVKGEKKIRPGIYNRIENGTLAELTENYYTIGLAAIKCSRGELNTPFIVGSRADLDVLIGTGDGRDVVEELFAGEVCRETMAFLNFVVKKNRSINLKGIAETYLEMYRESRNVILSKLTTATPVDESVKTSVEKMISSYTGKEVELITGIKSDIIGGLRVEFNNMMYDGSVSSKIAKLRRDFNKNLYESEL